MVRQLSQIDNQDCNLKSVRLRSRDLQYIHISLHVFFFLRKKESLAVFESTQNIQSHF